MLQQTHPYPTISGPAGNLLAAFSRSNSVQTPPDRFLPLLCPKGQLQIPSSISPAFRYLSDPITQALKRVMQFPQLFLIVRICTPSPLSVACLPVPPCPE